MFIHLRHLSLPNPFVPSPFTTDKKMLYVNHGFVLPIQPMKFTEKYVSKMTIKFRKGLDVVLVMATIWTHVGLSLTSNEHALSVVQLVQICFKNNTCIFHSVDISALLDDGYLFTNSCFTERKVAQGVQWKRFSAQKRCFHARKAKTLYLLYWTI